MSQAPLHLLSAANPVLGRAENSDLNWVAPDGVPSGWVVFSTDPTMQQRFMDPQQQVSYWLEPKLLVDDLRALF